MSNGNASQGRNNSPGITGENRDFVLVRAAEGASISQIKRELEQRNCKSSWRTIKKVIEQHSAEIEDIRNSMIRHCAVTYMSKSRRMLARNELINRIDDILDKVIADTELRPDSENIRNLKTLVTLWNDVINGIISEDAGISNEEAEKEVSRVVFNINSNDRKFVVDELKKRIPENDITAPSQFPDSSEQHLAASGE